jgi:hypothetical protein
MVNALSRMAQPRPSHTGESSNRFRQSVRSHAIGDCPTVDHADPVAYQLSLAQLNRILLDHPNFRLGRLRSERNL